MNNVWIAAAVMLLGVIVAGVAQMLLKKSATSTSGPWYRHYLNLRVIGGYGLLVASSFCSVLAYSVIPLSSGPVWQAAEQLLVAGMSVLLLGETINKRKKQGLGLIILGIILFLF